MSLRLYLRFLRPLRSLLFIACCTGVARMEGSFLFRLDSGTSWLITLSVALPLLLGIFIANAAHEPMHRSFALVLPNLRQRQRNAAAITLLIGAFAATCGTLWAVPTVSPVATFGLICALISSACLDRQQPLAGQAGRLAALLVWIFASVLLGPKLASAMNAFPGLFLFGGLGIGILSLLQGFSRESLRARVDTLFLAYQTGFCSMLFHPGMLAHWQAEVSAKKDRLKKSHPITGRDWTVRAVGTASRDWLRVFWYAKYGSQMKGSFFDIQLSFAAMTLGMVAAIPGAASYFEHTSYWTALAQCAAPGAAAFTSTANAGTSSGLMLVQPTMALLFAASLLSPQLAYPLSRERIFRILFRQSIRQWGLALVIPAMIIFLASILGQIMSGRYLPGYGLPDLLAMDLPLAVLLPLIVAVGTVRGPIRRLLAGITIGGTIFLIAVTRPHLSSYVLTLPAILSLLIATAVCQWFLWYRLRHYYATSDLVLSSRFVDPFSFGMTTPL